MCTCMLIFVFQADYGRDTLTSTRSGAFQLAHSGEAFKLKEWLEFQFRELHQKFDAVMETQSHLQLKIDAMAETQSHLKSLIFNRKVQNKLLHVTIYLFMYI